MAAGQARARAISAQSFVLHRCISFGFQQRVEYEQSFDNFRLWKPQNATLAGGQGRK
jgi:hypothetical protein